VGAPLRAFRQAVTTSSALCPQSKTYNPHLCARNAQEANRHQHSADCVLVVSKLDAIEILHAERVGSDEAVESQDLVHLDRRNERTPALADDMRNYSMSNFVSGINARRLTSSDMSQLRSEGCSTRSVSELNLGDVLITIHIGQLLRDRLKVKLPTTMSSQSRKHPERGATHLLHRVNLPRSLQRLRCLPLSLDRIWQKVCNRRRDWRWGLIEPGTNRQLTLINLLDPLQPLPLRNLLQILLRTVKKRNTNVRLLESPDVVGTVASHERDVAEGLERSEDEFFLRGRNTGIDPGVLDEVGPAGLVHEGFHGGSGNANIVLLEEGLVDRLIGIDRNELAFVNGTPDKI